MLILLAHALAALVFGVLALSQVRVPEHRAFATALAITALWALAIAGIGPGDASIALVEAARDLAWLAAMALFVRGLAARDARTGVGIVAVYVAVATIALAAAGLGLIAAMPVDAPTQASLETVRALFRMLAAAGGLMLVNHAHAACVARGRGRARFVALALAAIWCGDLLAFGARYADLASAEALAQARGVIALFAGLTIVVAGQRRDDSRIAVSRAIAVRSLSAAALAGYAGLIAVLTSIAAAVGGEHARLAQTAIVIGATVALLTLLSTPWLRAWAKVKIAKHLFSHRYDYRVEWRRFTDTLGSPDAGPLACRIVKAIADLTDSPAGLLLVAAGRGLEPGAAWNWDEGQDDATPLAAWLASEARIVELDDVRRGVADAQEIASVPAWLVARADAWAIVPLAHGGKLAGAVVLARPPVDRALDWEDLDLLRLAGTQAASHLAEDRAHGALAEAQRFDEFSRRFAFLIHDIKNLASQLALVARNAERHAANPDFRADMVATLKDSSDRMATLLARLAPQEGTRPEALGPVDAGALVHRIARARRAQHPVIAQGDEAFVVAHAARLEQVIGHLVQNAIEASTANAPVWLSVETDRDRGGDRTAIVVADTGAGMSAAFVRDELFRPFASTKPDGFGIGAFEARQLVNAMGGTLGVTSREGEGTCFRILMPTVVSMEVAA